MIISKEVYDAGYTDYIPYAMTNTELTKLMENSKEYSSSFVRGINHRGYNYIAPENTIPAYVLSKKYGFDTVETDISFTSDGIPVLLHDDTVDRTSNGTGSISSMTYEEARALDFGSWKSEEYAETKIPSFDEFVKLCRDIGLNIYAELKGTVTQEQADLVAGIIKKYHMENNTTWISFSSVNLAKMVTIFPTARIGFVVSTVTASTITTASNLKNGTNEVFIDCSSITNALVEDCITEGIGVERWTINTRDAITNSNPYISGFTSDSLTAGKALNQFYNV
jgi:glycerophosphoryl diester phosphodiesterase